MLENQDNAPVVAAGENNAPVATPPLVNVSHEIAAQSADNGEESNAPVANVPVVIQAGLGRLICEQCGKEAEKRVWNQRFCCTPCRVANWEKTHGRKVSAG